MLPGDGEIVRTREPGYRRGVVATEGRDHVPYRRITFPLARDGEDVDRLIFVLVQDESVRAPPDRGS